MLDLLCGSKSDKWVMKNEQQLWREEYTIDITILGKI